jgi:hypothetical protein
MLSATRVLLLYGQHTVQAAGLKVSASGRATSLSRWFGASIGRR